MFFFCCYGLRCRRVPVLRNRFDYFSPPLLAAVPRFLHWWLPLPPPAVIEYSLAFRSLAGMRVRRRNQRSQFVVRQYEREEGFEATSGVRTALGASTGRRCSNRSIPFFVFWTLVKIWIAFGYFW